MKLKIIILLLLINIFTPSKTIAKDILSQDEVNLMIKLVQAEAEAEPTLGKRLVIDTVLNRVDSVTFPNTIKECIYQKNQFSPISDGRINKFSSNNKEIRQLILEECEKRSNSNVVFFRTKRYSSYGVPALKVGHHYFSKEVE